MLLLLLLLLLLAARASWHISHFVMDVRNNFCYLCKSRLSLVINGSPTKPCPCPCFAQYAHISNSISLLCGCGSTFNLYLVHTHTQTETDGRQDKCIDQMCGNTCWFRFVWLVLTHTRDAHISLYIELDVRMIYLSARGGRGGMATLMQIEMQISLATVGASVALRRLRAFLSLSILPSLTYLPLSPCFYNSPPCLCLCIPAHALLNSFKKQFFILQPHSPFVSRPAAPRSRL